MQRHAAQQLHVKVAHFHDPLGAFAHHRKGFGQQGVQRLARRNTLLKLLGLATQGLVREGLQLSLHRVDAIHTAAVLFEQAVIATAE